LNCVKELVAFSTVENFENRIIPIMVESVKIYQSKERFEILNYWKVQYEELKMKIDEVDPTEAIEEIQNLKALKFIKENISDVLNILADILNISFSEITKTNYKSLIQKLESNNDSRTVELLEIQRISNEDERIKKLTEFITNSPTNFKAYYLRGNIYSSQNKNDKAFEDFRRALELNSESIEVLNNLATIYYKDQNIDKAIELYKQCIKLDKNYVSARVNLINCLFERGLTKEADAHLKDLTNLHSSYNYLVSYSSLLDPKVLEEKIKNKPYVSFANDYASVGKIFLKSIFEAEKESELKKIFDIMKKKKQ